MKTPFVMVPGTLCTQQVFAEQTEALQAVARPLVHLPRVGPTLEACAYAILKRVPQRFALLGFSLGGLIALEIMRRAPERVTRLCLMATNPHGSTQRHFDLWSRWRREVEAGDFNKVIEAHAEGVHPENHEASARVKGMALELGPAVFKEQLSILASRPDSVATLSTITCPTLLIAGDEDRVTPPKMHREMQGLIAGARLETLSGCGHYAPLERPIELSSLLCDWLEA